MNKLKKCSVRFGIAFLLVIAFLTYFSDTIDYMLLPKVKVSTVEMGSIEGATTVGMKQKYLVPLSAVITMVKTEAYLWYRQIWMATLL